MTQKKQHRKLTKKANKSNSETVRIISFLSGGSKYFLKLSEDVLPTNLMTKISHFIE